MNLQFVVPRPGIEPAAELPPRHPQKKKFRGGAHDVPVADMPTLNATMFIRDRDVEVRPVERDRSADREDLEGTFHFRLGGGVGKAQPGLAQASDPGNDECSAERLAVGKLFKGPRSEERR